MKQIHFDDIVDVLPYPSKYRAQLTVYHSKVVKYVISHYVDTSAFKTQVINLLNIISFLVITSDSFPIDWTPDNPFQISMPQIDDRIVQSLLNKHNMYIDAKNIIWDTSWIVKSNSSSISRPTKSTRSVSNTSPPNASKIASSVDSIGNDTAKEDLYIQPPKIPQFDTTKPWYMGTVNNETYVIFKTLPEIPTKQNQISVTTDVNRMTDDDLMRLYPTKLIQTRSAEMYNSNSAVGQFDIKLGMIFPICDFSFDEIRMNIIQYPHLFQLFREINNKLESFYSQIEIDGELVSIREIWSELPDTRNLPCNAEFRKEYVVRRYLLERDILGVKHKYPMFGVLDPYLTLFTTAADYQQWGLDPLDVAKRCVSSRVSYRRSRNPILRKADARQ